MNKEKGKINKNLKELQNSSKRIGKEIQKLELVKVLKVKHLVRK
jgi:hypothetical protein